MRRSAIAITSILFIVCPAIVHAQETENLEESQVESVASTDEQRDAINSSSQDDEIAELKEKYSQVQEENSQFKKQLEQLTGRLDDIESEEFEEQQFEGDPEFEPSFNIYGYFDMNMFFLDFNEGDPAETVSHSGLSFYVGNINLYFASQMTETLSALVEFRFTFLPDGQETSYESPSLGLEYERTNTAVRDIVTSESYSLGGVAIERVHVTWKPYEFFGVLAGRFLTPFGIWNVDHGAPIIIPVRPPPLLLHQSIPTSQTGVQIFGRFFPFRKTYLEYAITCSNGRGPTERIYDLDNNKALGFRLRGSYEGRDFYIALGSYLYWGDMTDIKKIIDENGMNVETTQKFNELSVSADLLIKIFNFKLQSEFMRGITRYSIRPIKQFAIINIDRFSGIRQADLIRWNVYGLLAYEIPFNTAVGLMMLTPFIMFEYDNFDDTDPINLSYSSRAGLNFKPTHYVTLKYEANYVRFPEHPDQGDIWIHVLQAAVSF